MCTYVYLFACVCVICGEPGGQPGTTHWQGNPGPRASTQFGQHFSPWATLGVPPPDPILRCLRETCAPAAPKPPLWRSSGCTHACVAARADLDPSPDSEICSKRSKRHPNHSKRLIIPGLKSQSTDVLICLVCMGMYGCLIRMYLHIFVCPCFVLRFSQDIKN